MTYPVILTGPPGSGKSTLAPLIAARLGYACIDLDRELERRAGASVSELFAREGEGSFRARESALFDALVGAPSTVIACGGGTLVASARRRRALKNAVVVGLSCDRETLRARTAGAHRPLLSTPDALDALLDARADGYAEAHLTLDTATRSPEDCARRVEAAVRERPLVVPLGAKSYAIRFAPLATLTPDALADYGLALSPPHLLLTDENVQNHWCDGVSARFNAPVHAVPAGEASKSIDQLASLWSACIARELSRRSALLCVGGGVVTDLGGMAAATYLRGIAYVSAPTSLLAMADASVGGKTAVNHPLGKNLVGVFHHPSLVHVDTATLATLSPRDFRAGMAEIVKIALARDASLLDAIEAHARELTAYGSPHLDAILRAAVQAKIDVVAQDPREEGVRAVLNLGHTLGHAVETASRYALRHGECVSIGTVAALRLGERLGVTPPALTARVVALLTTLGLPIAADVSRADAEAAVAHDKKRADAGVRMIFVPEAGRSVIQKVDLATARSALDSVLSA